MSRIAAEEEEEDELGTMITLEPSAESFLFLPEATRLADCLASSSYDESEEVDRVAISRGKALLLIASEAWFTDDALLCRGRF